MKRNGHRPGAAHLAPVYPPALARPVDVELARGEAICDACGALFWPLDAGEPGDRRPGSSCVPLCARCAALWHAEAA